MPPLPRSPYAANKTAAEADDDGWACSYGMDTAALRYFNIFGPRQNANSAYAAVIAAFAKALTAVAAAGDLWDGEQSRDFTFVLTRSTPTAGGRGAPRRWAGGRSTSPAGSG